MNEPTYAYLLGMYLGDGYIAKQRRIYSLRISLDERYTAIIQECRAAAEVVRGREARAYIQQREGCVWIVLGRKHWPCAFPRDVYGVAWRQMKWNTISIARKADVAKLDLVVGPKK